MRHRNGRILGAALVAAVTAATCLHGGVAGASSAAVPDSFYTYSGRAPLSSMPPGTVLKDRALTYHVAGISVALHVTQLLYRTTDAQGRASAGVTSVVHSPLHPTTDKVVGYQSFYDSLNPDDSPSRAIAGGVSLGQGAANVETLLIAPLLLQGYSVVVTDTEGQAADFAAGPEYGTTTLDAMRAVSRSSATGVSPTARVGLIGYSGGAIATDWAAALAPSYAPDVNARLVGAAEGGVLVDPDHNLHYVEGSAVWAGVLPMALIGVSRSFGIDLTPYMSDYGKQVYAKLAHASIISALGSYPGLTWAKLAKPQYAQPESIPVFVDAVNKLNLGSIASPTVPMFIGQGANGALEGTSGSKPGIGAGDGVMIAGDVRSLARKYCAAGTHVRFQQYPLTSHFTTVPLWLPAAYAWLSSRFGSTPAPDNCSTIPAGNPLTPVPAT